MIFFDVVPEPGGAAIGVFLVIGVLFIAIASGAFAFVMLRKTVKMAIRMAVVAIILLIAVVGSVALYMFMKPSPRSNVRPPRPTVNSQR